MKVGGQPPRLSSPRAWSRGCFVTPHVKRKYFCAWSRVSPRSQIWAVGGARAGVLLTDPELDPVKTTPRAALVHGSQGQVPAPRQTGFRTRTGCLLRVRGWQGVPRKHGGWNAGCSTDGLGAGRLLGASGDEGGSLGLGQET